MNYTKLPRELIYRDRTNLDEFTKDNELNSIIIENMEDVDTMMIGDFDSRALLCMNTAYYICTMMMLEDKPSRRWPEYRSLAFEIQQTNSTHFRLVVLSVVSILLRHYDQQWQNRNEKLIRKIEDYLKDYSYSDITISDDFSTEFSKISLGFIYQKLNSGTNHGIILPYEEFCPREIDYRVLKDTWDQMSGLKRDHSTDIYDYKDKLLEFIFAIGKDEKEQQLIANFLRDQLIKSFENGQEHKWFFDGIDREIHDLYHGEEDRARDQAEFEAYQEQEALKELEAQWIKERVQELEPLVAQLKAENEALKKGTNITIESPSITTNSSPEQELTIKKLQEELEALKEKYQQKEKELTDLQSQTPIIQGETTVDEMAVELLTPLFNNKDEETAKSFYDELRGKDDLDIVEIVIAHKEDFSPRLRNVELWRILHAAKKYSSTDRNFDTALRKRGFRR